MGGFGLQAAVHLLPSTYPMPLAAFARYEEMDRAKKGNAEVKLLRH